MPELKLLYWAHPVYYKDPCSSLYWALLELCDIFEEKVCFLASSEQPGNIISM